MPETLPLSLHPTPPGLEGKDAFEELKKLVGGASLSAPPKALHLTFSASGDKDKDKEWLVAAALEGLPVSGFPASWEPERPKVVPETSADKVRGC